MGNLSGVREICWWCYVYCCYRSGGVGKCCVCVEVVFVWDEWWYVVVYDDCDGGVVWIIVYYCWWIDYWFWCGSIGVYFWFVGKYYVKISVGNVVGDLWYGCCGVFGGWCGGDVWW